MTPEVQQRVRELRGEGLSYRGISAALVDEGTRISHVQVGELLKREERERQEAFREELRTQALGQARATLETLLRGVELGAEMMEDAAEKRKHVGFAQVLGSVTKAATTILAVGEVVKGLEGVQVNVQQSIVQVLQKHYGVDPKAMGAVVDAEASDEQAT